MVFGLVDEDSEVGIVFKWSTTGRGSHKPSEK